MRFSSYPDCCLALVVVLCLSFGCAGPYRLLTVADLRDADGWYTFPDFRYRGSLQNGVPHGTGEIEYSSGVRIAGSFDNGLPHGDAEVRVPSFGTVWGTMSWGRLTTGRARLADDVQYVGGFENWRFHGAGTLLRRDGSFDSGTFAGGVLSGEGLRYDARTGTRTVGTFRGGQPQGSAAVEQGGTVSMRHFDGGRDVTADWLKQQVAETLTKPQREQLERARNAEAAAQLQRDDLQREQEELAYQRSRRGREEFEDKCECYIRGCLTIQDRDAPRPTEEQKRQWEENDRRQRRLCREWQENLDDPNFGARMDALLADIESKNAVLERERERRVAAEAQLAQVAAEASAAQSARAKAELQRRREAADAEARRSLEAQKRRCAEAPRACSCALTVVSSSGRIDIVNVGGSAPCQ